MFAVCVCVCCLLFLFFVFVFVCASQPFSHPPLSLAVAFDVLFAQMPPNGSALVRTAAPTSARDAAEIGFDADGQVGIGALCDAALGRVRVAAWQHICFSVMAGSHVQCYINGDAFVPLSDIPEIALDGPLCLRASEVC